MKTKRPRPTLQDALDRLLASVVSKHYGSMPKTTRVDTAEFYGALASLRRLDHELKRLAEEVLTAKIEARSMDELQATWALIGLVGPSDRVKKMLAAKTKSLGRKGMLLEASS